MMITGQSKRVIPFRPADAKRIGKGCYYLDFIIWLNGEFAEFGDYVGFNYGVYVNAFADCYGPRRDILGDHASGPDYGPISDRNTR